MKPRTAPVMKVTGAFPDLETATSAVRTLRKTGYRSGQIRILRRLMPQQFLKKLPHPLFARYLRHLAGVSTILVCVSARNIDDAKTILESGGAQVAHNRYFHSFSDAPSPGPQALSVNRWHE
ncbi:hypothetical protein SAMN05444156_2893 [Verrucomicrobium sp. GAS474]|uniref:hypothetical protein n=1 Tax=Verrucomicrobium sp. GAS474 TaxID=1882831 RepID=UPI00087B456E|nr:hypothetical protein [Verrucomicrobium sp. GAS474]SDU25602.1 hypothetical protein SAMN05444156_2893 [Verrucomicrobium sp. GAS474]